MLSVYAHFLKRISFTPSTWLWDEAASASTENNTEEATPMSRHMKMGDAKTWIQSNVGHEMKQLLFFEVLSVIGGHMEGEGGVLRQGTR